VEEWRPVSLVFGPQATFFNSEGDFEFREAAGNRVPERGAPGCELLRKPFVGRRDLQEQLRCAQFKEPEI